MELIKCPFCGNNDYDLPGLANHLSSDQCDKFTKAHNDFWNDGLNDSNKKTKEPQ